MTEKAAVKAEGFTPLMLLDKAIQSNVEIDKLEKAVKVYDDWVAREARKKFFTALSDFQAACPVIEKNRKVALNHRTDGKTHYEYADLGAIIEQIKRPLHEAGMSYQFKTSENGTRINVDCIVTHKDGHSETNSMSGLADSTGSKNPIQQSGATVTYLQRYTLIGALGIGTAQSDNDGEVHQGVPQPGESKKEEARKDIPETAQAPAGTPPAEPAPEKAKAKPGLDPELQEAIDLCTDKEQLIDWAKSLPPEIQKAVPFRRAVSKKLEAMTLAPARSKTIV